MSNTGVKTKKQTQSDITSKPKETGLQELKRKHADNEAASDKKRKTEELYETKSSAEAHAKQRALAKQRKLAKPNANEIERAKKLWERLRRKSHVPKDERQKLVAELYQIITGKVKDFVFKHDSVRTIQTALKYATQEQRKQIAKELQGEYRTLVEGKYSKFLVAKILVQGDAETRFMVVQEFYGHVKRLINHPEASWILDDTYRQVATADQKSKLLREWYGAEFSVLRTAEGSKSKVNSDLVEILKQSPEKRQPILKHLHDMIKQLVSKRMTAFTMLHDAMLQYSLAISTGADGSLDAKSETVRDWIQQLVPDEEEDYDLLKNLAFTTSGCRVLTRALTMATAKDRRNMLKVYKDHIETVACDTNAIHVLLAMYEVVDDTRLVSKLVFPELLSQKLENKSDQRASIAAIAKHPIARAALLWPLVSEDGSAPKWLVKPGSTTELVMKEINEIKAAAETSKKQNETRKQELVQALLTTSDRGIFATIQHQARELVASPLGCQFMAEVLLHAEGDDKDITTARTEAQAAVANLAANKDSNENAISGSIAGGRMLKTLAQGGPYDPTTGKTKQVPWLNGFPEMLWQRIQPQLSQWATSPESFAVLALAENKRFGSRADLTKTLRKCKGLLEEASRTGNKGAEMLLPRL
ncbi:MAG: hypothetical protein Q9162_004770 [Coniocarpon cinnabarinum]